MRLRRRSGSGSGYLRGLPEGSGRGSRVCVSASLLLTVAVGRAGCGAGTDGTRADQTQSPAQVSDVVPQAVAEAKETGAAVDPAIIQADNAFGLRALQTLQSQDGSSNITISPLSLS